MSIVAQWTPVDLDFAFEAVTSRERMWHRRSYLVRVWDPLQPDIKGIGECGLFRGLSADDVPDYEDVLSQWCSQPENWEECTFPSIRFGLETAFTDLSHGGVQSWSDNKEWLAGKEGIPINGLIWMGDRRTMAERIDTKLAEGYGVLKLKIGGIDFEDEVALLKNIRNRFPEDVLQLRLDANGSFSLKDAGRKLDILSRYSIHSIEQPIKAGHHKQMAQLCANTPIPIALDEELIGWKDNREIDSLLSEVKPQYIILKPSLIGGFGTVERYVAACTHKGIGWWLTSALETNVGLNAIAQWTSSQMSENHLLPQGLGTGQLYINNIASPLYVKGGCLYHNPTSQWGDFNSLPWR